MSDTAKVLERLSANRDASLQALLDWLRIPSISTDPVYREHVRRAAEWAAGCLTQSGFDARVLDSGTPEAPGHPIVLATTPGSPDYRGPHVLFYGHYDVQPGDPVDEWETGDPFEPVIKTDNGRERIVCRGAVDDKGQVMTFLAAMQAWKEATGAPAGGARITVLLEGEEESASVNLARFIQAHKNELKDCDVCLISDTGMLGPDRPAITYGVRGLAYTEVTLTGPNQDLHSGLWGGRVANPISELVRILAQLWDQNRRVTIPGFYDDVRDITPDERQAWKRLGLDPADSLRSIGLPPQADVGEAGFNAIEREWARPTAEINGIIGGYTGKGAKTVIPSRASAKVSFRLVADQNPERIRDAFFQWLTQRTPAGFKWSFLDHGTGWPATVPTDSHALQAASRALKAASGRSPELIKSGGSIPVAGILKQALGIDTIFMGFGLEDDRVHSPNEKFELACYDLGTRAHVHFIAELIASGRR